MAIGVAEISKLRNMTGAGMMDCKKALEEANGDYEQAVSIIRKKGQLISDKRANRDATQGCVIAKVSDDKTKGALTVLSCETDFVAKGVDFIKFVEDVCDVAIKNNASNINLVSELKVNGITVAEGVNEKVAIIGEKIELSFFGFMEAAEVVAYIHQGNKLACLVSFNKQISDPQAGKNIAMQVASMAPVAVDKESVSADVIAKELEIAIDQAKNDPKNAGKPDAMIEKIAQGKLEKFFKEMTLLNQDYIKDNKQKVSDYLKSVDSELKVTNFIRFALAV